jgi:glycosyltransferase involved in cell wall biosynthesis
MLRVLHVIYDDPSNPWVGGGGAERVREIYRRLRGAVDATIVTGNYPGAQDGDIDGVRYRRLGIPWSYVLSRATFGAAATRRLRSARYDAAVVELSAYTPVLLPTGRPVAVAAQMLIGPHAARRWGALGGRVVARAERRWLRGARAVCSASHRLAGELGPLVDSGTRVDVVGNGVAAAFSALSLAAADATELLSYGRLDVHQKGIDVLLDAMREVRRARPGTRLRIAGRGRDAERVRQLIAARALDDAVVLEEGPSRERVAALLAGASLLVAASRFEGVPLAFMEAMAAGVPVVATDVGAVSELRGVAGSGIELVPPDDPGSLARTIVALLDDGARRHRMRDAGRAAARAWTWDSIAERHLAFLRMVAAGGGIGGRSPGAP